MLTSSVLHIIRSQPTLNHIGLVLLSHKDLKSTEKQSASQLHYTGNALEDRTKHAREQSNIVLRRQYCWTVFTC